MQYDLPQVCLYMSLEDIGATQNCNLYPEINSLYDICVENRGILCKTKNYFLLEVFVFVIAIILHPKIKVL
jgi:hypothetical protein